MSIEDQIKHEWRILLKKWKNMDFKAKMKHKKERNKKLGYVTNPTPCGGQASTNSMQQSVPTTNYASREANTISAITDLLR